MSQLGQDFSKITTSCLDDIGKTVEWFRNQKEKIGIFWFNDYETILRKAMEK